MVRRDGGWYAKRSQIRGVAFGENGLRRERWRVVGDMRNEPNFRVFRFGRISYGGVYAGLLPPAGARRRSSSPRWLKKDGTVSTM